MGPGFESLKVHHKKAGDTSCLLLFYRYTLKIQNSEKFRNAKFTLKLARSLHIGLSLFVALTGVLNPCFALLSVKFALQTFTLLFCFFRIFRNQSSQVSAIAAYRFAQINALTGVLNPCFASLSVKFALQTFTLVF